jgi:hypothetical protein
MIDLGDRTIADDGTVTLKQAAALEALYMGRSLDDCLFYPDEDIESYNRSVKLLDLDIPQLNTTDTGIPRDWYNEWKTPEPFASMDILGYCCELCPNDDYRIRTCEEYILFEERGMIPVLRHLTWVVYYLRKMEIVWGVGRGSSVSSLLLYLIGINRIDPMKFGLDISEFLK